LINNCFPPSFPKNEPNIPPTIPPIVPPTKVPMPLSYLFTSFPTHTLLPQLTPLSPHMPLYTDGWLIMMITN
jgi:hypothetical protein